MAKDNKKNSKEEIIIKKSTIIAAASVLVVIFILIMSWGKIDNLIKNAGTRSNDIVAEVNGEKITASELDEAHNFFFFITGYPQELRQVMTREVFLEQLISEKLLLQEVEKQEIELNEDEFEDLKEKAFGANNLSETELKTLLESNNVTYDYFIEYYKKQILITKLLNKTIVNDIQVTEQEIAGYYEDNKADFADQSLEEVKDSINALLINLKQREVLKNYIDGLKSEADIKTYLTEKSEIGLTGAATIKNECIQKYGVSDNTVIFYHADWCPHCNNMKPIVQELENQGFSFVWVETEDNQAMNMIKECFSDVIGKGVPEFICAGSKEVKMGEMSKSKLKEFAENCN